jgi:hypothetical protein
MYIWKFDMKKLFLLSNINNYCYFSYILLLFHPNIKIFKIQKEFKHQLKL